MQPYLIGSVLFTLTATQFAAANDWTVVKGGGGDFETIQSAIDYAADGDRIVVHEGIYTSTTESIVDFLGKHITVTSLEGPETTFIDGQLVRRGVYFGNHETVLSVLEGFTITNCVAPMNANAQAYGGGILCENESSPTITNCVVSHNTAPTYNNEFGWFPGFGGGIALLQNSNPLVNLCTITNNYAEPYVGKWGEIESKGGGIFCNVECSLTITNSTIIENSSSSGAGVYCLGDRIHPSDTIIDNCTITMNSAIEISSQGGGGIMCYSDAIERITSCTISDNVAITGGGIRVTKKGANPLIEDCLISNNIATNTTWYGGGLTSDESGTGIGGAKPILATTIFCSNFFDHIYGHYTDSGGNVFYETCCESDITGDGDVGVDDILILVSLWETDDAQADINNDGIVGTDDLLQLIADWGLCQ